MADLVSAFKSCIQENFGDYPSPADVVSTSELDDIEKVTSQNIEALRECLPANLKEVTGIYDYPRTHAVRIYLSSPLGVSHTSGLYRRNDPAQLELVLDHIRQAANLPSPGKIFFLSLIGAGAGVGIGGASRLAGLKVLGSQIKLLGFMGLVAGAVVGGIEYMNKSKLVSSKTEALFNQASGGIFQNVSNWELSKKGLIEELTAVVADYEDLPPEE